MKHTTKPRQNQSQESVSNDMDIFQDKQRRAEKRLKHRDKKDRKYNTVKSFKYDYDA